MNGILTVPGIADRSRTILVQVGGGTAPLIEGRCVVVPAEEVVARLAWLKGQRNAAVFPVASSEETKSVAFRDAFIARHGDRLGAMDALVVVGGGTVLNFGTALAARLRDLPEDGTQRGNRRFRIVLIPTTLLSMADAAYGSSGLLNDGNAKNAVSLKLDPDEIIIDPTHLATLPVAEKKRGLSECLKHALMQQPESGDGDAAPSVEECLKLLRHAEPDEDSLLACVLRTIRARAQVTAAVNAGNGQAANLPSYGHLDVEPREAASCYQLSHGDAVLLGLMTELSLAGLHELAAELREVVPYTPLAGAIDRIGFSREAMRDAYGRSARPRFRAGGDRYRIVRLARIGEFARLGPETTIDFLESTFDTVYDEAHRQLTLARKIASAAPPD